MLLLITVTNIWNVSPSYGTLYNSSYCIGLHLTLSVIGVGMRRSRGEESTTAPYDTDPVGGPRYKEDSVILK